MEEPQAHSHTEEHSPPLGQKRDIRRSSVFILSGLSSGHGVFHWFTRSFEVMLPEVQAAFGLSAAAVGGISATREFVSGVVALPGGIVTDLLRRYWGMVLTICMALFGVGWLVMGAAPIYYVLLAGMGMVAMSASIWHLPAAAALSHHFSHRRGMSFSFHGVGGNIGDVAAPVVTGALLGVLSWQGILNVYAAIPLFLAFLVLWAFRDIGRDRHGTERASPGFISQMGQTGILLRNPRLWGITLVAGLRGMAFISFVTFLPLYLNDVAGLSPFLRGAHITLLVLVGVASTPVMGYLSDRLGRKLVLVPGMVLLGIVTVLLVPFGQGVILVVLLAILGAFLFSDQPLLMAAALDIVGEGVAATTLGVVSFSRFLLSAAAAPIAGVLYARDVDYTFYFVAGLYAVAAVVLLLVPLKKAGEAVEEG